MIKRVLALLCVGISLLFSSCSVVQDIWLPDLALVTPAPTDSYLHHIVPRTKDPVYMAWEYRPQTFEARPGLGAVAPMWLYLVMEEGQPVLQDLTEMGYANFDAKTYVSDAHEAQCEVWATVVGFEPEATSALVRDEAAVEAFAEELAEYVENWDLDGINLDFENMDPEDTDRFTQMVKACRSAMPDSTLSVCVTVPVGNGDSTSWYQSYDRAGIARNCDYIAVMAYDGHKEGVIAPVAGEDWVRLRLEMLLYDVPSNRILLGIPMHGTAFVELPESEKAYDSRLTVSSKELEALLQSNVLTVGDAEYKVAAWIDRGVRQEPSGILQYRFRDDEGRTVTLFTEDETSLRRKIALADEYSLGGVAVWQKKGGADAWWTAMQEAYDSLERAQN